MSSLSSSIGIHSPVSTVNDFVILNGVFVLEIVLLRFYKYKEGQDEYLAGTGLNSFLLCKAHLSSVFSLVVLILVFLLLIFSSDRVDLALFGALLLPSNLRLSLGTITLCCSLPVLISKFNHVSH